MCSNDRLTTTPKIFEIWRIAIVATGFVSAFYEVKIFQSGACKKIWLNFIVVRFRYVKKVFYYGFVAIKGTLDCDSIFFEKNCQLVVI